MAETNDDLLRGIDSKLQQLLRLAALQITGGMKQGAAIQLLATAGFERRLIADILNTTPNTVSVTLSTSKSKTRSARPRDSDLKD
jgi:hypothetical protein